MPAVYATGCAKLALGIFILIYGYTCVQHGCVESAERQRHGFHGVLFRRGTRADHRHDLRLAQFQHAAQTRLFIPPMFAGFPMAPLSLLPHNAALAVFYALNVAMLLAAFWMLRSKLWPCS